MGWFDEQIRLRKQSDQEIFEDSIFRMASSVVGHRGAGALNDQRVVAKAAIDEVMKFYRFKPAEVPDDVVELDEQLEYCLRPHGIMRREVRLEKNWYKDAFGPMLGFRRTDGLPVALLPRPFGGYWFHDPDSGEKVRLDRRTAETFDENAICFYLPLPQKKLGIADLIAYMGLHGQIRLRVAQFIGEGDQIGGGDTGEVGLQIGSKVLDHLHGAGRILPAEHIDGGERVEDEMGPDLAEEHLHPHVRELALLTEITLGLLVDDEDVQHHRRNDGRKNDKVKAVDEQLQDGRAQRDRQIDPESRSFPPAEPELPVVIPDHAGFCGADEYRHALEARKGGHGRIAEIGGIVYIIFRNAKKLPPGTNPYRAGSFSVYSQS